jgi:hypothetical protein
LGRLWADSARFGVSAIRTGRQESACLCAFCKRRRPESNRCKRLCRPRADKPPSEWEAIARSPVPCSGGRSEIVDCRCPCESAGRRAAQRGRRSARSLAAGLDLDVHSQRVHKREHIVKSPGPCPPLEHADKRPMESGQVRKLLLRNAQLPTPCAYELDELVGALHNHVVVWRQYRLFALYVVKWLQTDGFCANVAE